MSLRRFVDALTTAGVWHRQRGDHVDFRCPLPEHEDRDASGSADWRPGSGDRPGSVRLLCHACGPAATDAVVAAVGLGMVDLFDDPPARPSSPRARPSRPTTSPRPAGAATSGKGEAPERERGRLVATHVYCDSDGAVVGECRRFELPSEGKGKPGKRFVWRYRGPAGGWIYRCPADVPLYRLPSVLATARLGGEVWVVEGERNADDLAAAGVVATTAPNGARRGWRVDYTAALAGAAVVVVADRDAGGYAHAAEVAAAASEVASSVRVVRTPLNTAGADATDHLAAGLALDAFEPVDPAEGVSGSAERPAGGPAPVSAGEGTGAVEVCGDCASMECSCSSSTLRDDAAASSALRSTSTPGEVVPFPGRHGDGQDAADERRGGDGGGGSRRWRRLCDEYGEIDGGGGVTFAANGGAEDAVFQVKYVDGGERVLVELLNCRVRIARRIAVDPGDGSPVGTTHVDLVAERAGERIALDRVPWEDFRKGAYLHRLPWALVWKDTPQGRSTLANAITQMSGPVPVVTAFGTLGWRETPADGWVYAHAAGGIGAAGAVAGVEVEVAPRLAGFTMPTPPADADELRSALAGVLGVLDELPARIAAPVMGAPLRAILGETCASVFVLGHPGTRKSGLAALAQQVHCPGAKHNRLPVGAGEAATTTTAMEELLWQAGDALLVADDLAPDRGAERSSNRANELLRMVGNGASKARGARTGGLRVDRPPRSLLMLTGEDGASRPSAESRTVYVPLAPGDVPLDVIRGLSARELVAGRNAAGAALARHVAGRMPVTEWVDERRDAYSVALLAADPDPDGMASRRADLVAELAVGWRALLDAAVAGGALEDAAAREVWARVWAGLVDCLARQVEVTERRSLVDRTADLLRSSIRAGRAHLQAAEGGAPLSLDLAPCGWTRGEGQFGDVRASGESVGWTDGRQVWLDPGAVFATMERQARAESDPLGVTQRALTGALVAAGVLTTERVTGRATPAPQVRRRVGGARQRVWELPWSWLWPDDLDDTDNNPDPDAGPDTDPGPGPDTPPPPADPSPAGTTLPPTEPAPENEPERPAVVGEGERPGPPAAGRTGALSASRTDSEPARRYRAAGVVVDVDQAHLIGAGPVAVPDGLDTLPDVAAWAAGLELGTAHARSRDDAGQVWIMPALGHRLRLHKAPDKGSKRAVASHPAAQALTAAGWELGNRGVQAWTHVWRPGGAGMHLVVVPWLREDAICDPASPPAVRDLAERLDLYATMVGLGTPTGEPQPWLYSAASTGTALLRLSRATAQTPLGVVDVPEPAAEGGGRRWEPEFSWQRPLTEEERRRRFVVAWDVNAQYLAAAAGANLGLGNPRHVDAPTVDDSTQRTRAALPPGYWHVYRPGLPSGALLPDLMDPAPAATGGNAGWVWITTPTLVALLEHGIAVAPAEAWIWDGGTRWMESWAHALRDARYALTAAGADVDPETRTVQRAVKLTYAGGIGMLGSEKWRKGTSEYRPDARQHIIALAKANLYRKCAKAAAGGWAPVAIERDAVLFAADSDDPDQNPPPGFTLGTKLGQVKWAGLAEMTAELVDAFGASTRPGPATVGQLREA